MKMEWETLTSLDRVQRVYRRHSIVDLIRSIALESDERALSELHNHRRVFHYQDNRPLRLVEFIGVLRQRAPLEYSNAVDQAYDLTVDKFSHLPSLDPATGRRSDGRSGPDCRYYFNAFLDYVAKVRHKNGPVNPIQEERLSESVLQGLVCRHFQLSLLESSRNAQRHITKYEWRVNGDILRLWFPARLRGKDRRTWLENHVDSPDPSKPSERARIQAIINQWFNILPMPSEPLSEFLLLPDERPALLAAAQEIPVRGFAKAVAREKALHIEKQRPSIQALGPDDLEQLVLRIFNDLNRNEFNASKIAREFNLNESTLNRFAKMKWDESTPEAGIPDLWLNAAQTLCAHPLFIEAAQEAGVWDTVNQIQQWIPPRRDYHGQ